MEFHSIVKIVSAGWPGTSAPKVDAGDPFILVPISDAREVLRFLKEDADMYFDSLMCLSGVDTGHELWIVYNLHSFKHLHKVMVKVVMPRENPCRDRLRYLGDGEFL